MDFLLQHQANLLKRKYPGTFQENGFLIKADKMHFLQYLRGGLEEYASHLLMLLKKMLVLIQHRTDTNETLDIPGTNQVRYLLIQLRIRTSNLEHVGQNHSL